jgi:hypothetical protein
MSGAGGRQLFLPVSVGSIYGTPYSLLEPRPWCVGYDVILIWAADGFLATRTRELGLDAIESNPAGVAITLGNVHDPAVIGAGGPGLNIADNANSECGRLGIIGQGNRADAFDRN